MKDLQEISNEDDLLAHLMESYRLGEFAKVSRISTLSVSPEIDLLNVDETQKIAIGYEFKLLKYVKRWKRTSFYPLYSGIGQALLYLQHGINRTYLVVGVSPDIPRDSVAPTIVKIEKVINLFRTLRNMPTGYRYPYGRESIVPSYNFDCFGIMLWTPSDDLLHTKLKAERDYVPLKHIEDLKHKNICLLRREFKYDKAFLEKQRKRKH